MKCSSSDNRGSNTPSDEPTWWISRLTVAKCSRCHGLGSQLTGLAEETARSKGAKRVRILVGNMHSRAFWFSRGYQIVGVKWKLLGHRSVFMEKELV
mmetsp:Transcript_1442/g.1984  ORF Transcript_1442/g.1984 Transcript_1442/m.1984 type:complete len:97 (-) Transcript_1442:277-567(-)